MVKYHRGKICRTRKELNLLNTMVAQLYNSVHDLKCKTKQQLLQTPKLDHSITMTKKKKKKNPKRLGQC